MDAIDLIKRHEGLRLKPYRDTRGNLTIGVGRNLDAEGISEREAQYLLTNDIIRVRDLLAVLPFWGGLDEVRQAVLLDMAFNMGVGADTQADVELAAANNYDRDPPYAGLLGFKHTLRAVALGDFISAATGIRNSAAADELPQRYTELADMMNTGRWPQ